LGRTWAIRTKHDHRNAFIRGVRLPAGFVMAFELKPLTVEKWCDTFSFAVGGIFSKPEPFGPGRLSLLWLGFRPS
jgi:hypothetical protein